jgi:hypothetical protein
LARSRSFSSWQTSSFRYISAVGSVNYIAFSEEPYKDILSRELSSVLTPSPPSYLSKILYLLVAIVVITVGLLDTRPIMKLFGLRGSPTTPQSASGRHEQRPVTQQYTSSNSYLKPPTQSAPNDDTEADYPPLTAPVAPIGASIAPFRTSKTASVLFYDKNDPFYEFTNFSPHDIIYKGKRYPTSEHLFQAFKFLGDHPELAERIRNCGERPMLAFDEAHRYQKWVRSDWRQVNMGKVP